MSRIPRPLARRLDRLARGAHAFHRYAHHPLCGAYAGEVVRVGRRTRLCRGCLLVMAGAVLGGTLGALASHAAVAAGGVGAFLGCVVLESRRGADARRPKWRTRALPMVFASYALVGGLESRELLGMVSAAMAVGTFALGVRLYRRRGPDRSPCASCPDRERTPCPGMVEIWRREKAFQRVSARLITAERSLAQSIAGPTSRPTRRL